MAIDLEAIKRKVSELQTGRKQSNVQLWKPKEPGEYVIRILPWPEKYTEPGQPFVERQFYYIGDNFGMLTLAQFKKPDPVKELIDSLYKSGTPDDKAIAKKLRAKPASYAAIYVKKTSTDADKEKTLVWTIPRLLYGKMLGWFLDSDIGDYTDPEKGYDVKVLVTDNGKMYKGKKQFNFDVELARKSTPLASNHDDMKKILDAIPDINELNEIKSYDEMAKVLKTWIDGGAQSSNDDAADSAERVTGTTDALDELASEVKSAAKAEKSQTEKQEKTKKKSDDGAKTKQDLDAAFDELMKDD